MSYFFRIYHYPRKDYLFSKNTRAPLKKLAASFSFYQCMKSKNTPERAFDVNFILSYQTFSVV